MEAVFIADQRGEVWSALEILECLSEADFAIGFFFRPQTPLGELTTLLQTSYRCIEWQGWDGGREEREKKG
jgi:hypothetical protein